MTKKKTTEAIIFLVIFILILLLFAIPMGLSNALTTIMNTAYRLLIDTCFYILAITVIAGALAALLSEFGVIDLINKLLSPLMKPLYGLPGAASLGIVTTFFSDNPAILTLANDNSFRKHFKKYQIPALTNIGTAFGMGLVVITYVAGLKGKGEGSVGLAILAGFLGAVIGSIISTRLMLLHTKKKFGKIEPASIVKEEKQEAKKEIKEGMFLRILNATLEGGKNGVTVGLSIIPGVCIICTLVLMLTNGMPEGGFTGEAYEGIGLLPFIFDKLSFIITPLFGFKTVECVSVPITALGSAGAALSLIPNLFETGRATANDLAVFTSMCMCWSGYLSTHVAMMDALNCNDLTGKAILSHTLGGLCGGIAAHYLYLLFSLI